jgi:hypothetical protein
MTAIALGTPALMLGILVLLQRIEVWADQPVEVRDHG